MSGPGTLICEQIHGRCEWCAQQMPGGVPGGGWLLMELTHAYYSQTGCSLVSNIAILSHNIAILIGRLLWAICNRREQIAIWNSQKICKQSLWLDYKKGGSTNPVAQTVIGFPLSYNPVRGFVYRSYVNFQLAICSCRLQFAQSNLPTRNKVRTNFVSDNDKRFKNSFAEGNVLEIYGRCICIWGTF
jgi:hypothetical protein